MLSDHRKKVDSRGYPVIILYKKYENSKTLLGH
jgi:hypothetical protein